MPGHILGFIVFCKETHKDIEMYLFRIFVLLACLVQPTLGYAYDDECPKPDPTWWMNFGVGTGYVFDESMGKVTSQLSFNGRISKHIALTFYRSYFSLDRDDDYIRDSGLMLGYLNRKSCGYLSISSGIAIVARTIPTYYWLTAGGLYYAPNTMLTETTTKVSLPLQVQAFWTPFKHVGFGIIGHGIVVPDPYASLMLGIQYYT